MRIAVFGSNRKGDNGLVFLHVSRSIYYSAITSHYTQLRDGRAGRQFDIIAVFVRLESGQRYIVRQDIQQLGASRRSMQANAYGVAARCHAVRRRHVHKECFVVGIQILHRVAHFGALLLGCCRIGIQRRNGHLVIEGLAVEVRHTLTVEQQRCEQCVFRSMTADSIGLVGVGTIYIEIIASIGSQHHDAIQRVLTAIVEHRFFNQVD